MTSAANLETAPLSPDSRDDWRAFVGSHAASTAYHTLAWKRAVEQSIGYDSRYQFVYDDSEEIQAVVPTFETPETLGRSLTNPFCEYGYPLVADRERSSAVLATLSTVPRGRGALILKDAHRSGVQGYHENGYAGVETGVTYELSTAYSFDFLWENSFNNDARSNVRTARDGGVEVREESDIASYYDLYLQTMARLGSPPFPRSFFGALADQFGDSFRMFLAEMDGRDIGGLLCLDHDGVRHVFSNASDPDALDRRPNERLYAAAIESACEGSLSRVDFGRTEPGSELAAFKAKFGASDSPLSSFVTPARFVSRASISEYKQLEPITRTLAPVLTHPRIGPALKRWVHE
jgi:CelD/BcsL family acetyltransferase involved in cellulose biosynthesis